MQRLIINCNTWEEKLAATALAGMYGFQYKNENPMKALESGIIKQHHRLYKNVLVHLNTKDLVFCNDAYDRGGCYFYEASDLKNIINALQTKVTTVKISRDYDAVVTVGGIQVGCQNISFADFDKLVEAVKEVRG